MAMAVCDLFTVGKEDLLLALDGYVEVQVGETVRIYVLRPRIGITRARGLGRYCDEPRIAEQPLGNRNSMNRVTTPPDLRRWL